MVLLRVLASVTTLLVSLSPLIFSNAQRGVASMLSVPPLGHYFHSLIVLSAFCGIIVIQIVLVLLSKHR